MKCSLCEEMVVAKGLCMHHYKAMMARKYRAADPEGSRQKKQAWREKNKDKERATNAIRREKNRETINAKARAHQKTPQGAAYHANYYLKNKDQYRENLNKWRRKHPERARAQWSNRQSILRGARGSHTADEIKALFASQCGVCNICKTSIDKKYHKDHITALANGGPNDIGNIQLLCPSCNTSKGTKDNIQFMKRKGYLL